MSLEEDLTTVLEPVFGNGQLFQNAAPIKPPSGAYAVFSIVAAIDESFVDGATPNLNNARVNVTILGRDKLTLIALVKSSKAAMLATTLFKSVSQNEMDDVDELSLMYAKILDFSVWRNNDI